MMTFNVEFTGRPPLTYSEFYVHFMQLAHTHIRKQTRAKSDKQTLYYDKEVKEKMKVRQELHQLALG